MRIFLILSLLVLAVEPTTMASAAILPASDTVMMKMNAKMNNKYGFHFAIIYGSAIFSARSGVVFAYYESGYPYHVVSKADPAAKAGQPALWALSLEKSLSKRIFFGVQYSTTKAQEITGSNWQGGGGIQVPVEQFDVKETYSSKFVNLAINYIVAPVNFLHSRLELTVGTGLSFNEMKLTGSQKYARRPNYYSTYDDTSASYSSKKKGIGFMANWSVDFYWSHFVSTQFKMEFRNTPSLVVPEQRMTYLTTRSRVRLSDTRVLKKHTIRYSGTVLSVSLRFHI